MRKSYFSLIPYAVVILLIVYPWFLRGGYLLFTDFSWGPIFPMDWQWHGYLIQFFMKLLSFVIPSSLLEKFYLTSILAGILAGGWFVAKAARAWSQESLGKEWYFPLSLFALFNPFVYDRAMYGQFHLLAGYALLLFVVCHLSNFILQQKQRSLFFAILLSGFAIFFSLHFFYLLTPFFILTVILLWKKKQSVDWRQVRKDGMAAFTIVLLLSIPWILPLRSPDSQIQMAMRGITDVDLRAFQTAGKSDLHAFVNVIWMSGFWGKEQFRYADLTDVSGWQRSFFVLLILMAGGVWMMLRKKTSQVRLLTVSLLIMFAVTIFLALGIRVGFLEPFARWYINTLPFYKGFREPQKWVAVLIPIYLFFLTWGVIAMQKWKQATAYRGLLIFLFTFLVIAQAPLLLFGFDGQARPVKYPEDWKQMHKILIDRSGTNSCDVTTLFLPWHLYLSFPWTGKVIANPAPVAFSCPMIISSNTEFSNIDDRLRMDAVHAATWNWIEKRGDSSVAKDLPFRYIILAKVLDWEEYVWLNHLPNGTVLVAETENFRLYEFQH